MSFLRTNRAPETLDSHEGRKFLEGLADARRVVPYVFNATYAENVGSSPNDLVSHTVRANTFSAIGDGLHIVASGGITPTANNKRVRVDIGGTVYDSLPFNYAANGADWWLDFRLFFTRKNHSTLKHTFQAVGRLTASDSVVGGDYTHVLHNSGAWNLAADQVVKITGQGGVDSDVWLNFWEIELIPAGKFVTGA